MKSSQVGIAVAVLLLAGAGLLFWKHFAGFQVNLHPSAAVGEVLAEEIGRLLEGQGEIVLVSRHPPAEAPDANRQRIESLTAALGRTPGVKLAAPDWLPRPPTGVMDLGTVSAEQMLAAFDRHPEARAFLILAGLPPFSDAVAAKAKARAVKLIAVCGYSAHVRRWLESKSLAVVVVPRFADLPAGTPEPKSARDWFEREYQLFTPETVGQLPY